MDQIKAQNRSTAFLLLSVLAFTVICLLLHSDPIHLIGAAFCHQIPSRSPAFSFPFCYRCSGLFCGIFFGESAFFFRKRQRKLYSIPAIILFIISFIVFVIDILNSSKFKWLSLYPETLQVRFLSGFPLGFILVIVILQLLDHWISLPAVPGFHGVVPMLLIGMMGCLISVLVIFGQNRYLSLLFRFIPATGAVVLLTALYSLICICIAILRNSPFTTRKVLVTGFSISLLHIIFIGGIHLKYLPFERFFS